MSLSTTISTIALLSPQLLFSHQISYSFDAAEYKRHAIAAGEESFAYIPRSHVGSMCFLAENILWPASIDRIAGSWSGRTVSSRKQLYFSRKPGDSGFSLSCFNLFTEAGRWVSFDADWSLFETPEDMSSHNVDFYPKSGFTIFSAPFCDGRYNFVLICPRGKTCIEQIESRLTDKGLRWIFQNLQPRKYIVAVRMPCLKIPLKRWPGIFWRNHHATEITTCLELGPAGIGKGMSAVKIEAPAEPTFAVDQDFRASRGAFSPDPFDDTDKRDFVFLIVRPSDKAVCLVGRYLPGSPAGTSQVSNVLQGE